MPKYNSTQFAKLVHMSAGSIGNYANSGKIIRVKSIIDTDIPHNKEWLKDREALLIAKGKKFDTTAKPIETKQKKTEINLPEGDTVSQKIKQVELRRKEAEAVAAEIKLEKLIGSSMPTKIHREIISQLGDSFINGYKHGAESFLNELFHELKVSVKKRAKFKGRLIEVINQVHDDSVSDAEKNTQKIVNQLRDGRKED